jgi:hypothetical protein
LYLPYLKQRGQSFQTNIGPSGHFGFLLFLSLERNGNDIRISWSHSSEEAETFPGSQKELAETQTTKSRNASSIAATHHNTPSHIHTPNESDDHLRRPRSREDEAGTPPCVLRHEAHAERGKEDSGAATEHQAGFEAAPVNDDEEQPPAAGSSQKDA